MTTETDRTVRKAWTAPVLEQLTVDLDAIANSVGTKTDKNKTNNAKS